MNWLKKIFQTKQNDENKKQKLFQKIEQSIKNCQLEIKKSEKEINNIKKWMAELIQENFFVPADYWYEEIKYYPEIKNHKENSNISKETINQVNKLLNDYQIQIRFREKKIELKQLMLEKFQNAKKQLIDLKSSTENNNKSTSGSKILEKHQNRIQKLNETQNELSKEQEQDELLHQLIFQINELMENQQIDDNIKNFMKKLNTQFTTDFNENNPEEIIYKMQQLINEYKSKK